MLTLTINHIGRTLGGNKNEILNVGDMLLTRNGALDVLKIFLALMVIGMHAGFLTEVSVLATYLTSNGLFRIAVPVFLLINGYFFYHDASIGTASRWFRRVLLLYVFWMVVYLPFWLPEPHQNYLSFSIKVAHTIFFGYYHLWYLSGMIGAALVVLIMIKASARLLIIVTFATFLTGVIIQYIANYQLIGNAFLSKLFSLSWSHRNFIFFSFPFFCAGYLINKHKVHTFFTVRSAVILCGVGGSLLFFESYLNFSGSALGAPFDNLASLAIICPAIFILFMKINMKGNGKTLAMYSAGIYLIHVLIISITQSLIEIGPTSLTIITVLAATFVSYFLIKLNRKFSFIL